MGTVNYDPEALFNIRSRYLGELTEVALAENPKAPRQQRPLRFGDKFKQGDLLAVVWSKELFKAKAVMVDALSALRVSQDNLKRLMELINQGAASLSALSASERQVQADLRELRKAERDLIMLKLGDREIEDLKGQAKTLIDQKKTLDAKEEMKWGQAEIRVPWFDKANPNRELVVLEKNANVEDVVDPNNSPPIFKLADTSKLQIWVFPPDQDVPLIKEILLKNGKFPWQIRFPSDSADTPPRMLEFSQMVTSPDINASPMITGYLPNPEGKYLIGQFVSATITLPVNMQELAIPAPALVEERKAYVLIQPDPKKYQYALRPVSIVRRGRDVVHVIPIQQGAQTLAPGDRVVTKGVVELKATMDDLREKSEK